MSSTEIVGAMPPPEGVTPDFSLTMTTVQHKFIVVYSITFGIAVLLLLLRLYTRAFIVRSLGLDDCMLRHITILPTVKLADMELTPFADAVVGSVVIHFMSQHLPGMKVTK